MAIIRKQPKRGFWTRLRRLPRAWIGIALVLVVIAAAIFAPLVTGIDPLTQFRDGLSATGTPLPPDARFLLGTDHLGRDMFSRMLYGARISLLISLTVNISAAIIGTAVGLVAGYYAGILDNLLMRVTDILLAFPAILLALGFGAVLRPSIPTVIIILVFITWAPLARLVRAQVLTVRERPFIESARAIGCRDRYILVRQILPQIITVVVVWGTLSFASTILVESSLSFLGVGVPLPTASWGNMIAEGQTRYRIAPWTIIAPTIGIIVTTLGFNLLGDALRDALDPRTKYKV
ncbi:MAG: ABC transporter permease [Chloroflexi bacterium]|jgi:peptide/nickel transport system permease protein|uniref:ABC transporter permease n=1 Tax=Candidatus Flexifilum breve TaxID=3140694 RepID=UPI003136FFEF|nr:ABC transporter permease [Chloroflexota bacterium]